MTIGRRWFGTACLLVALAVEVSAQTPPAIYASPANSSVRDGANGYFTVYFEYFSSPNVQWETRSGESAAWQSISGATVFDNSSTLTVARVNLSMNGWQYRCILSNSAGAATSNPATLTVTPSAPWFHQAPQSQYVAVGQTAVFTAELAGTPPFTIVWLKDGHPIPGATELSLTIPNVQASDAGIYRLAVSNALGPVSPQSSHPSLVIVTPPTITGFSDDQAVPVGGSAYIQVNTSGDGPKAFRWFRNGVEMPEIYQSFLHLDSVTAADAGTYVVMVSNIAGSVTTRPLTLTVYSSPLSGASVRNSQVSLGGSTTLSADYYGPANTAARSYQWYRDGTPIPGAQSWQHTITNATLADLGDYYVHITVGDRHTLSETVRVELDVRITPQAHEWIDATDDGGVAYFLFASPARIARYDLVNRSWLTSWTLPAAPVAFARAADAWYVAYAATVVKYDASFANGTTLLTAPATISQMGLIGEQLVVTCPGSFQWNYRCYDRQSGTLLSQINGTGGPRRAFSYNSTRRIVYGASNTQGGGGMRILTVSSTGLLTAGLTDYPDPQVPLARTFSLNDGALLVSTSGLVIDTATGTSFANFGRRLDDVIEDGAGGYFGLRQGKVVRWDAAFRELASLPLDRHYQRAWLQGSTLLSFAQPTVSGDDPPVRAVEIESLAAPASAPVVEPRGLALYSPQVSTDGEDLVYLHSKVHRNVLRWSAVLRDFLPSVPLTSSANSVAVMPETGALLYEHSPNQIRRVPIDGSSVSTAFASSPGYARGLYAAGQFLVLAYRRDDSNSAYSHVVFNSSGEVVSRTGDNANFSVSTDWSPHLRQLYYFRSDTIPPNILRLSIDDTGRLTTPAPSQSPYHSSNLGATPPARVDPAAEFVATGGGEIFELNGLSQVKTFALKFTDLAWANRRLYTLRDTVEGCVVEAWTRGTWNLVATLSLTGRAVALRPMRGDRLLLITEQGNVPSFAFLRADTLVIEPEGGSGPLTVVEKSPDFTAEPGGLFTAWVVTTGGEIPSYQWQMRRAGSSTWEDVADGATVRGARTGRLEISAVDSALSGARFRVRVSNSRGTVMSDDSAAALAGQSAITDLAASNDHLLFLRADGGAWFYRPSSWSTPPAPSLIASGITAISAGNDHSGFLTRTGTYLTGTFLARIAAPAPGPVPTAIKSARVLSLTYWLLRDGTVLRGDPSAPVASGARDIVANLSGLFWVTADDTLMSLDADLRPRPILTEVRSMFSNPQSYTLLALKRDGSLWNASIPGNPQKLADDVIDAAVGSQFLIYATSDGGVWTHGGGAYQTSVRIANDAIRVTPFAILRRDGSLAALTNVTVGSPTVTLRVIAHGLAPISPPLSGMVSATSTAEGVALSWASSVASPVWEVWRGTNADGSDAVRLGTTGPLPHYIDATAATAVRYHYWVRSPDGPAVATLGNGTIGEKGSATLPVITQQPTRSAYEISIRAIGSPVPIYQWEYRPPGSSDWSAVGNSGHRTANLSSGALGTFQAGTYLRCIVSNAAGSVSSDAIPIEQLIYTEPLRFTSQPSARTIRIGSWVSFSSSTFGGGAPVDYQWFKDNVPVPGATSSNLVIDRADFEHAGNYRLRARAGASEIFSDSASLTVQPAVPALTIAAADNHTLFVVSTGAIYVTGSNHHGQLWHTSSAPHWQVDGPTGLNTNDSAVVATGRTHSLRLDSYGAYGAGSNTYGQSFRFATYSGYERMVAVAAGGSHTLTRDAKGNAWAVGRNHVGQLGDLTTTDRTSPVKVMSAVRYIAASEENSYFVDGTGALWGVGASQQGQLGAAPLASGTPTVLATDVVSVAAATRYVTFLKSDGTLWVLGTNAGGIFGADVAMDALVTTPRQIASNVVRMAAGESHLAFVQTDGSLWTLGDNTRGQLGTGDTSSRSVPVQIAEHATAVACGAAHTVFVDNVGAVWGCGANSDHQLGLPSAGADVLLPQRIWATEAPTAPAQPTEVKIGTSTNPAGLVLSWNPQRDASTYQVFRNTVADLETATPLVTDTHIPSLLDFTAAPNTTYHYWVRARAHGMTSPATPHVTGRHSEISNLPVIISQPSATLTYFRHALQLSVYATSNAGTLIYQWRRNGVPLPGGLTLSSNATIIESFLTSDAGDYDVVVSNSAGSVISNAVRVTGTAYPAFLSFNGYVDRAFTTDPITLVATTSSGLEPIFEVVSGPAQVTGNQLHLTGTGTVVVRASVADSEHYAGQTLTQSFEVSRAALDFQLGNLTQRFDGQPKPVNLFGLPVGVSARVTYDGSPTAPSAVGRYTIVAEIESPNFLGTKTSILTILPGVQTISFALPWRIYGPVNLQATSTTPTPLQFAIASGPATLEATQLQPAGLGFVTVTATQAATADYDAGFASSTTEIAFGFPLWQAMHFSPSELVTPTVSAPNADADGDGLDNLLEYALGLDPRSASIGWDAIRLEAGFWVFTYSRPSERPDLTYFVEASTDLQGWSTDGIAHQRLSAADGIETWEARRPVSAGSTRFFRLKVLRP